MQSQGFHQGQKQVQSQVFTAQLGQSLEILQVSALELRDVILGELQSNPVLEELSMEGISIEADEKESSNNDVDPTEELDFKDQYSQLEKINGDWQEKFDQGRIEIPYTNQDAERREYLLESVTTEKSLQEYIIEQAKLFGCAGDELKAMELLVGSLDDRGFLISNLEEISKFSGMNEELLLKVLEVLKNLDPIGLGSPDVQECLLVQLKATGHEESMAARIIRDHYPLLLRRRIPELAKALEMSVEGVQNALEEIATLDPAPGRRFKEDNNRTVVADARIEKVGDDWVISLNNEYIPKLRLSKTYKDLVAKGELTEKEREYIQDKMRSGKFLLNAIEQRQKTLERITEALLKFQKDFFNEGVSGLHPLTMSEAAVYMGVHETTVSRAVANKFLETPYGLFPYKYFFTSGYSAESEEGTDLSVSSTSIKEQIAKIVQSEPSGKPYSDQKIMDILGENGVNIARRTVAKYREELGILATNLRRKY